MGTDMIAKLHATLYDAIEDKEQFTKVIYNAVHQSLVDLGDRIYDLEWASVAIAMKHREALKAAA